MTVRFVTRHHGARDWAESQAIPVDLWMDHLDTAAVESGDVVIGTLPIHLAAEVHARGARYLHLSLDLPPALRGRELSAEQMIQARARLEEYLVVRVEPEPSP